MRLPVVIGLILALYISSSHAETTWKQIEQPYFRLIFKSNIESEAERVADKLNLYFNVHLEDLPLNRSLRPIDVVLQTEAQINNGFVGLTPYRSVWFNRPGAFTGLEWFDALAVHESRHIVQFNQIYDTAMGRALGIAFGDMGSGLMAFFLLPSWYLEGDAVLSETLETGGGRGRVAAFDLWLRTDILSNNAYPYDRAILGTDFDRLPYLSPYVLGYYLTGHLQTQTGSDVFERSLDQIGINKGFNFNGRIRAETGLYLSDHYNNMVEEFKSTWRNQLDELELTSVTRLTKQPEDHWNSLYPVSAEDGKIVVVEVDVFEGYFLAELNQSGYQRLASLPKQVAKNYYTESKIKSVFKAEDQFCWVSEVPHRTKVFKNSGDLFCWSESQGIVRKTLYSNLTSATYSKNHFLVHQFNADQSSVLQLRDSGGSQITQFQLPPGALAFDLIATGNGWLYVLSGTKSDGIYEIDFELANAHMIKAKSGQTLRSPMIVKDRLIYTSDQSGIDQLMNMSLKSGHETPLATRPFGSYYPIWDANNQAIVFSDYAPNGQQLSSFKLDAVPRIQNIESASDNQINDHIAFTSLLPQKLPVVNGSQDYQVDQYSRLNNLWNPHSWSLYGDGDTFTAFLSSSDPLETLNLDFFVNYETANRIWDVSVLGQYRTDAGPLIVLYAQETFDAYWGYPKEISAQLMQPFLFQKGAMQYQWTPGLGAVIKQQFEDITDPFIFASLAFSAIKDKPLQAIHNPLFIEQSISGLIPTGDESTQVISHTLMDIRGFTPRQNLNIQIDAQQKPENTAPLLLADSVFAAPDNSGLTVQSQVNYQMNLGAVGMPITSLLFWRNTEISANFKMQQSTELNESAVGLSIQPNMNILRNDRLIVEPMMSVFYHLQNDAVTAQVSLTIIGN